MADVKQQIRKLLNIAADDAASEAEIENALAIAAKIMARHHLSEDDLAVDPLQQTADIHTAEKGKANAYGGLRMACWEKVLAKVTAQIVGGVGYYVAGSCPVMTPSGLPARDRNGNQISAGAVTFYGIAEDCGMAVRLYDELRLAIISLARIRYGSVFKGDGAAYAEGFVSGLQMQQENREHTERAEAQKLLTDGGGGSALILVDRRRDLIQQKNTAARKWLESPAGGSVRLGKSSAGGSRGDYGARENGRADGSRYNASAARSLKLN